jgi:predicted GIY-YIG superfamily endonuclease
MRTLTSLRRTYDYQMRERSSFAAQRAPLHDRRRRSHSEQRYRSDDVELLYHGPLVVCLRHRGRVVPRECVVRRTIRRYWPGAPVQYEVWEPCTTDSALAGPVLLGIAPPESVPSTERAATTGKGSGATLQTTTSETTPAMAPTKETATMRYLDDEACALPLLDTIAGVQVPQIEVLLEGRGSLQSTATLANDDALAVNDCNGCVLALYHRFTVRAAPQDAHNEWCVYVLRSDTADADVNGYVGVTPFVDRRNRLAAHNGKALHGATATESGRPWRMVCTLRGLATRQTAETIEAQIHRLLPNNGPLGPFENCLAALETHKSARSIVAV